MTKGRKRKADGMPSLMIIPFSKLLTKLNADTDDASPQPRSRRRYGSSPEKTQDTNPPVEHYESTITSKEPSRPPKPPHQPQPSDSDAASFKRKVSSDQKALEALLNKQLSDALANEQTHRADIAAQIANIFQEAAAAQSVTNPPKGLAGAGFFTNLAGAGFFTNLTTAALLVQRSHEMLRDYDAMAMRIEDAVPEADRALPEVWRGEEARVRRVLEVGYRVAVKKVEGALGVERDEDEEEMDGDAWKVVRENFQRVQAQKVLDVAGTVRYAERGVMRMAKGLPWERMG
ncbi:uncharacterized protein BDZ99DRAFT_518148 [Mytilinidion resinicola]|uniref:Uncharacterized protein n=1 Tax=Mytilinidion resinicola TaxID=574789 RepID=A0A6A6YU48_9PEZI|nr:uncharacterized protein BDZ99DRAFT_518148 [Mytilinidion resinicola]KAF2812290.1 hypothetical protein BDZ99DRAFT_518148 [Mytilinidion resinicola]